MLPDPFRVLLSSCLRSGLRLMTFLPSTLSATKPLGGFLMLGTERISHRTAIAKVTLCMLHYTTPYSTTPHYTTTDYTTTHYTTPYHTTPHHNTPHYTTPHHTTLHHTTPHHTTPHHTPHYTTLHDTPKLLYVHYNAQSQN